MSCGVFFFLWSPSITDDDDLLISVESEVEEANA